MGSWNESLVPLISGIDSCETLDVPWLARHTSGTSLSGLVQRARAWRTRRFDLAVNFEPDIRTNLLLSLSRAPRRVGFSSAGGGAFLTDALVYEPVAHTAANALRLVDVALPRDPSRGRAEIQHARLLVPEPARQQALALLENPDPSAFFVGIHASGGRTIKQWHTDRFAEVAARIARNCSGAVVLTGTSEDRPLVDRISSRLPADIRLINVAVVLDLPVLAGLPERLHLFATADTGPMHLAAAVGTPVVGLFGPSDPRQHGPLSDRAAWSPQICVQAMQPRAPPTARCEGHVPDCMEGIDVEMVYRAACEASARHRRVAQPARHGLPPKLPSTIARLRLAHRGESISICQRVVEGLRERICVAWRDEPSIFSWPNLVGKSAGPCRDDGASMGHRFERNERAARTGWDEQTTWRLRTRREVRPR